MEIKNLYSRRRFLEFGSKAFAGFFLSQANNSFTQDQDKLTLFTPGERSSLSSLELQEADTNGIRLPKGFQSRLIAQSDKPVISSSNFHLHHAPDGGACFETDDGGWIYVSNSEIGEDLGGVGALRFNAQAEIVDAYPILSGTNKNCAGGKTPWGTWLSCEEIDKGLVYECDPFGLKAAEVRPALGRFKHEAVAVDPINQHLFLTEDVPDGGFYRFTSDSPLPNIDSGKLEVAEVTQVNGQSTISWREVLDPSASTKETRYQVNNSFGFNGGEGIIWNDGKVYFTTKGDNKVWVYDTLSQNIDVLYDAKTAANPELTGVDNITITASGDVLVAEDGGDMQIVMLDSSGIPIPILQIVGQDGSEICGPAFDPSFQRLYFSSQRGPKGDNNDGRIYEIFRVS